MAVSNVLISGLKGLGVEIGKHAEILSCFFCTQYIVLNSGLRTTILCLKGLDFDRYHDHWGCNLAFLDLDLDFSSFNHVFILQFC